MLKTFWTKHHKRYVEPFAGSACLFFALKPEKAILGDLNPELISTYIEIKFRLNDVMRELDKLTPWSKTEYLRLRALDTSTLDPDVRAARFIYLNRFCFNGIYRTNLKGHFNVPYSGDRCGALPDKAVFRQCSKRLQGVKFVNKDFERVLEKARRGDLVYIDPPYAVRARRVFKEYDPSAFSHGDIQRLRLWMERLDRLSIDFVVSYAESDEADILKNGFSHQTISVRRNIAGFASHRAQSNEILVTNMRGM